MVNKPAITVFMPMYNAEKYIGEAIDSILGQTFKDFELLIIDDGSTDESCRIVESYNDKRIRLYSNDGNKGLPYTRNRGLELARGKYLAIMDADDVSINTRLKEQWDYMERHSDTIVLASGKDLLTDQREKQDQYSIKEKIYSLLFYRRSEQIGINLIFENVLSNSTTMVRLSFLKAKEIKYNPKCFVMQDYELWTQIYAAGGKFHMIPKALVKYRNNQTNITSRTRKSNNDKRKEIQRNIQKTYLQKLGYKLDEKWEKLIIECGVEYEDKQGRDVNRYLDVLFLYYKRLIKKYSDNGLFSRKDLIKFFRKKYFIFSLKTDKKRHYILKGFSLGKY